MDTRVSDEVGCTKLLRWRSAWPWIWAGLWVIAGGIVVAVGLAWWAAVRRPEVDLRSVGTNWPPVPILEPMHGNFRAAYGETTWATEMYAGRGNDEGTGGMRVW